MSMHINSLVSGSSGNCIYVGSSNTHLLIDAGTSGKRIEQCLNKIDLKTSDISGILVTHEHSDHIKGLGVLARRYNLPIFATQGTIDAIMSSSSLGKIDKELLNTVKPDTSFAINDLTINPYKISHDAIEPVCYTISNESSKIGFATDLGTYDEYIVNNLKDSNILYIEANHDINMLQVGSYPYYLKRRILSDKGHLSNELSGKLICELLHDNIKHIMLGHLSNENNFPELALETVQYELNNHNYYKSNDFEMSVAKRSENSILVKA